MTQMSYIKSVLSLFILTRILGWRIKKESYNIYKKGRYVSIFLHSSIYDHVINVLFSYAMDMRFITIATDAGKSKHTQLVGLSYVMRSLFNSITSDQHTKKENKTTCESIVDELVEFPDFIFGIYPEGSIYRTPGLKAGFYKIARNTDADILLLDLNYATQEIDLRNIIDRNIVKTAPSRRILEIASDEMSQTVPYDVRRTYILNEIKINLALTSTNTETDKSKSNKSTDDLFANPAQIDKTVGTMQAAQTEHENQKSRYNTSLININRSVLRFIPIIMIVYMVVAICIKLYM